MGVYKTNIDYSFIWEVVENYCTLGKIQPWPTIHMFVSDRLVAVGPLLFLVSPCFIENVNVTCKIVSFCVVYIIFF